MACSINDGFISTIDYSVNFNLHSRVITVTDLSTGPNLGDITSYVVTIGFPTGSSTDITVTVGGTGTGTMSSVGGVVAIGLYTISAAVTDSVDTYTCDKDDLNICQPQQCEGTQNSDGCLVPSVTFKCNNNYLLYVDRTNYKYQSIRASSITYDVYAVDPDLTVIANHVNVSTFTSSPIVNGRYVFTISNTAVYSFGSGVTVSIVYAVSNKQYFAACNVNLCDAKCAIEDVYAQYQLVKGNGSTQAVDLANKLAQLNSLFMIATLQQSCGDDGLSDTILEIEKVARVKCSCGCGTATSTSAVCCDQTIVIDVDPGLDVTQTTAGDTTTFTLENTRTPAINSSNGSSNNLSISTGTAGQDVTDTFSYLDYYTVSIPISFESGEQGTNQIYLYGKFKIVALRGCVTKVIAGTDAGTVTCKINGTSVTNGVLTFPLSSALNTIVTATPSALNTYSTFGLIDVELTSQKTTVGGKAIITLVYQRNGF